eukprot:TRINITY_DN14850_c0_g1_i1.p1 TRINITY_DN14850_c0_g1~~TRINITY_DN14850_c0_g1_i1.p1  ORF type:complete len:202 (-),score=43.06 TRINITY_DN14850_c0_g1_i1:18-593(-)
MGSATALVCWALLALPLAVAYTPQPAAYAILRFEAFGVYELAEERQHLVAEVLPHYPAVTVEFNVRGTDRVYFYDTEERLISATLIGRRTNKQIISLLEEFEITTQSPKYVRPIPGTEHCVAWRQRADCLHHGLPEPQHDHGCHTTIKNGLSGFCQCSQHNVTIGCKHAPLKCAEECLKPYKRLEVKRDEL